MHWTSVCEVNDLPHALYQVWLRQNPSTANAAQPIRLGQATGHNEIHSKMKRRTPGLVEQALKVHLVHQDARSNPGRHRARLPHSALIGKGAAWVVKVAENHQTRLGREFALELDGGQATYAGDGFELVFEEAARELGISRATLLKKIKHFGL